MHVGMPTGAQYPQRDDAGNLLTTEFGLCRYIDNQVGGWVGDGRMGQAEGATSSPL